MSKLKITIGGAIVLAGAALFLAQQASLNRLRDDNLGLQRQRNVPDHVAGREKPSAPHFGSLNGREFSELLKLRGEATRLRHDLANLDKPSVSAATNVHKESWSFAGYRTPEAAVESLFWSTREGELKSFMESCTPERRKALEQRLRHSSRWVGKSETEIAQALADGQLGLPVKRITGFAITGVLPVSNATDELDVIVRAEGYLTYVVRLKRIDSEWKVHQ